MSPGLRITARPLRATFRVSSKALMLAAALTLPSWIPAPANAGELWPLSKVRVTVVQWSPIKGVYERWEALSGEYMVGDDGMMVLPVIGALATTERTNDQIAADVAGALRDRLGLVSPPETTVEIISYPPIYVVGEVAAPGAFDYVPGMTVLQAFTLSGGTPPEAAGAAGERLRLAGELRLLADSLLRTKARLARLNAESAGAQIIEFPPELMAHPDEVMARTAMAEEKTILETRQRQLQRQAESLDELVALLNLEIETLTARIGDIERSVASAEEELAGVQALAEKGLVTAARQSELERVVANLRFDGLTQRTAIIRARQALSEASREAARLEDDRRTQLALDLQTEQTKLQQMLLQQVMAQSLLLNLDGGSSGAGGQPRQLAYTIVRQSGGGHVELVGDELTVMVPGDVLKVTSVEAPASTGNTDAVAARP